MAFLVHDQLIWPDRELLSSKDLDVRRGIIPQHTGIKILE